jgi:transcription elongation GreA/GreB family factor
VIFSRDDGRVQKYRIVGEDEADPKAGSISFVSPVARSLMGKAVGDVVPVRSLRSLQSRSTPAPDAADVWDGRFARILLI